ncbi:uncharacterized protein EAF01_006387 [Botrytis porri]|uniref:uncharacterized protein n=1 Tax=Botrytis porri TaxID=87229 RepID=UPI0018FF7D59|nr:uncharacterized protein EAF01_006387 [Botrytis porri]KAF7903338.1 hypothetical protein EAF01_006387 [Botrytis porri]
MKENITKNGYLQNALDFLLTLLLNANKLKTAACWKVCATATADRLVHKLIVKTTQALEKKIRSRLAQIRETQTSTENNNMELQNNYSFLSLSLVCSYLQVVLSQSLDSKIHLAIICYYLETIRPIRYNIDGIALIRFHDRSNDGMLEPIHWWSCIELCFPAVTPPIRKEYA